MATATPQSSQGWFSAPAPIRTLFKSFPLRTYASEDLPARAPSHTQSLPRLYIFSETDKDAELGRPSCNPTCLKWQTILRIANIDVVLIPSSNHASPSGALPFLIPASSSQSTTPQAPISSATITRFIQETNPRAPIDLDNPSSKIDAYQALLANNIRPAWLQTLYLNPTNDPVLSNLYLPQSILLRPAARTALHAAATSEILKTTRRQAGGIDREQILADARAGFEALSALLGAHDAWFFGAEGPGLLDADVFAYTHLLLGGGVQWRDTALAECLVEFGNLVEHERRLYFLGWGKE